MKKIITISLIILAVLTGVFFYVRYQIKLYKTVMYTAQKELIIENFLTVNFPDQVKTFNESLIAK